MADLTIGGDYNILFEDDNVLIVDILSNFANKYFGSGTPWYDGDDWVDLSQFRNRISGNGKIIYVVDKKTNEKFGFLKDKYGVVYQDEGDELTKDLIKKLQSKYPSSSKILDSELNYFPFKVLRKYVKGIASVDEVASLDYVYRLIQNNEFRGDNEIILEFENDEVFFDMLGLGDEDIYLINRLWGGHYDFEDFDSIYDDSKDGYGYYRYLTENNDKLVKKIAQIILPGEEFNNNSEGYMSELFSRLYDGFQRNMDEILSIITDEINDKSAEHGRITIEKEFNKLLSSLDLKLLRNFDRISTSVANLIYLYMTENKKWDNLKELLKDALSRENEKFGAGRWGESWYELKDGASIDYDEINRKIELELEEILERLEEDDSIIERFGIIQRLEDKYTFRQEYSTTFQPKIYFTIISVNSDNKIVLRLRDSRKSKMHSFTEEDFYKFVNNPQLFSIFD